MGKKRRGIEISHMKKVQGVGWGEVCNIIYDFFFSFRYTLLSCANTWNGEFSEQVLTANDKGTYARLAGAERQFRFVCIFFARSVVEGMGQCLDSISSWENIWKT